MWPLEPKETMNNLNQFSNHGKVWGREEMIALLERFSNRLNFAEIALLHRRTEGSIKQKLIHMGWIDQNGTQVKFQLDKHDSEYIEAVDLKTEKKKKKIIKVSAGADLSSFLKNLLETGEMSIRLASALSIIGVKRFEDILSLDVENLKGVKNVGRNTFFELERFKLKQTIENLSGKLAIGNVVNASEVIKLLETVSIFNSCKEISNDTLFYFTREASRHYFQIYLNEKESSVLLMRYGLLNDQRLKLQEVGDIFNISKEGARQIEKRAQKKINTCSNFKIYEIASQIRSAIVSKYSDEDILKYKEWSFFNKDKIEYAQALSLLLLFTGPSSKDKNFNDILMEYQKRIVSEKSTLVSLKRVRSEEKWNNIKKNILSPRKYNDLTNFDFSKKRSLNNSNNIGSLRFGRLKEQFEYESSSEKDFLNLLRFNPKICKIYEQPLKISYTMNNRACHYYPDFVIQNESGNSVIVEVKNILLMLEYKNICKYLAAIKFAHENQMGYLVTDGFSKGLQDYVMYEIDEDFYVELKKIFILHKKIGYNKLLSLLYKHNLSLKTLPAIIFKLDLKFTLGPSLFEYVDPYPEMNELKTILKI